MSEPVSAALLACPCGWETDDKAALADHLTHLQECICRDCGHAPSGVFVVPADGTRWTLVSCPTCGQWRAPDAHAKASGGADA